MGIGVAIAVAARLFLVAIGWFGKHSTATPPDLSLAAVQQRGQQMNAVQYRQTVTLAAPEGPTDTITPNVVNVHAAQWQVVKLDRKVLLSGSAGSAASETRLASDPTASTAASTRPSGKVLRLLDEFPAARATASDLQWRPRDSRGGTVLKLRTRLIPEATGKPSEGKILVVPTGGNIDHMPIMAIPPGCKILIPGTPDRGSGPSARSREEAQAGWYEQKLRQELRRRGSAGTQPSASQPWPARDAFDVP
jgi:hypothetical protein